MVAVEQATEEHPSGEALRIHETKDEERYSIAKVEFADESYADELQSNSRNAGKLRLLSKLTEPSAVSAGFGRFANLDVATAHPAPEGHEAVEGAGFVPRAPQDRLHDGLGKLDLLRTASEHRRTKELRDVSTGDGSESLDRTSAGVVLV